VRLLLILGASLAPAAALAHAGEPHGPSAGCFATAMLALSLALIWPFDVLGGSILSAHMVQHLLLTTVAAPLLVLSAPLTASLWALPLVARRTVGGLGHAPAMREGWRWLTLPLVAWAFYAGSLWLWQMPRLYEAAARDELVHFFEHLSFLVSALVLWWAALRSARMSALGVAAGVFLLFTTAVQDGLLGALLVFSPRPLYGFYVETAHALGRDPLTDQQLAGVVMWVFGGTVYLGAALALAWRLLPAHDATSSGCTHDPVTRDQPFLTGHGGSSAPSRSRGAKAIT
jgi:putative membrane protein